MKKQPEQKKSEKKTPKVSSAPVEAAAATRSDALGCWEPPMFPKDSLLKEIPAKTFKARNARELQKIVATLRRGDVPKPTFFVGTGTCGLGAGAGKTLSALKASLSQKKIDADVVEVGCVGLCSEEPILEVQLPGRSRVSFGNVTEEVVPGLLDEVLAGRMPTTNVLGQYPWGEGTPYDGIPSMAVHPFLAPQKRWVLANCGIIDPGSIDEYIAMGGYSALAETLRSKTPLDVCNTVLESGLRGRGGGGFPTGRKWLFARASAGDQKYLICNADEGDPGAFMDRAVAESDPHRLLEGMVLAAYAIGATKAYIYIRAEYPLAIDRLVKAIAQAQEYGLLGSNILNSGFNLEIHIKKGAGAFVCGEETALIHSIEGKRGMPRPRPPYPVAKGVFDKPTVINNVETLANLPAVLTMGGAGFASVGTQGSKGTKVFALSGMVRRTGLVEVAMGRTLRDVVVLAGGGIPGGKKCKAVQIGGPSGGCIPEPHLDIPCDYEALKNFGAIMGSGGLVVLDENTCMVDLAKFFMEFIQKESCGKCIPCREGTRRMLEILEAITRNRSREKELDALLRFQGVMMLQELGDVIRKSSLCGLGQTAPNPVLSTIRWFRDEYEAHIFERRCPSGSCKELVGAPCQTGCPVGTEVWRYVAHTAKGEFEAAYNVIREANPLPSTCARVCNHPCESMCRAGATGGEPIAARTLKRFVVDHVDPSVYGAVRKATGPHSKKVAVVGAGPSGLTAAHQLSLRGHRVTLLEREDRPGGMLVSAIPSYRLPRDVLKKEIDSLLNGNIEVMYHQELGRDFTVESLLKQGFDAVYLSTGSHKSRKLGLAGEDVKGVLHGIQFLKGYNLRGEEKAAGRVGIVGGGNSALDAARVAVRQKAVTEVTVFYRRTEAEMPAYREEVEAALAEGIRIVTLVTPLEVLSSRGKLTGVRFQKNRLGERDASGRRSPVPIEGEDFDAKLDTLIIAISESPELELLGDSLKQTRNATLATNRESLATSVPAVFAGGDLVAGPRTVIEAIADGKNAAVMIDRYLLGKQMRTIPKVRLPGIYVEPVEGLEESDEVVPRPHPALLPVEDRRGTFCEVELCISKDEAIREARRCLRCDLDFTRHL